MLVAVGANATIAVVKGVAGAVSGSSALLAEAAHSVADTSNQILLLVSIGLGDRPPDEEHPFGYGKERFFWTLLAAMLIFLAGAIFSIGQGVLSLCPAAARRASGSRSGRWRSRPSRRGSRSRGAIRQVRGEARDAGVPLLKYVRQSTRTRPSRPCSPRTRPT